MLDEKHVRQALAKVQDPELGRSIVELGMLRQVAIAGERVHVTLALTTMGCPLKNRMAEDIRSAIHTLDPQAIVEVDYTEMRAEDRSRLIGERKSASAPAPAALLNHVRAVVAVMSGKGGVGKSSVAAMLAVALQRAGLNVGVLDADITGPSIPKMFGLHITPGMSPLGIIPPRTAGGTALMSINLLLEDENQAVIWRGPMISGAIKQFWDEVIWGTLDVLVVDLPPGTSDASLTVLQSLPVSGVLMVTSPQDLAGMVVRKAAQMADKLNVKLLGLVENMSYLDCPHCGEHIEVFGPSHAQETAASLGTHLLGQLPLDPTLAAQADTGAIESYVSAPFAAIANGLIDQLGLRC